MPIDYSKYPSNWKEISLKIRKRARGRCECRGECGAQHNRRCNAPNGEWIWRDGANWYAFEEYAEGEETPRAKTVTFPMGVMHLKAVKVVLTVAHLNHDTTDNRDENLRAWCQFCHLRYDLEHHKKNAAETRRRKKVEAGQLELGA